MTTVQTFDSFDDLLASMNEARAAASKAAASHHIKPDDLKAGDYFISVHEGGPIVFAQVVETTAEMCGYDPEDEDDMADLKEEQEMVARNHANGYIFSRGFSVGCPGGELGDIHITRIDAKISEAAFKAAQTAGWVFPAAGQS